MSPKTNPPTIQTPLQELRAALAEFAGRCRSMRWFGALFRVGVAQDIVADVALVERKAQIEASTAGAEDESADRRLASARTRLEVALRGGLHAADSSAVHAALADLRLARAAVQRSARRDLRIARLLS